jgi:hypothetical protein
MSDDIPETGDVVIHRGESNATLPYTIHTAPGPDQLGFATRAEAEGRACRYAERSAVNLWLSEAAGRFALVARFRGAAHGQPRQPPSAVGVVAWSPPIGTQPPSSEERDD